MRDIAEHRYIATRDFAKLHANEVVIHGGSDHEDHADLQHRIQQTVRRHGDNFDIA
ncbi:unnamed protein product, partial [Prorocentrum cordatum]